MKQDGVVCWPGPALLFFIFRFEYLISGPKSYRDFRETGPWPYNRGLKTNPGDVYANVLMEKLLLVFTVTPSKIKIKTVQQIEQSRIWQMNWSKYAKTLAKIQVSAIFYSFISCFMRDIQRNVPTNALL